MGLSVGLASAAMPPFPGAFFPAFLCSAFAPTYTSPSTFSRYTEGVVPLRASERIMSDLDRLHEIIDALPPQQIHALLDLLESGQPIGDDGFARRLAEVPEEDVDDETAARILAAEAEQGESISHGELKQRLGL